MSPRNYSSPKRQAAAEETRTRMLAAARVILSGRGVPRLTVDTVAQEAGVSRQTVYNAFGSKTGLLEALCDHLAERGGLTDVGDAFSAPDGEAALRGFVAAFCRFWAADRTATRRLRGLSAIDADLGKVIRARDERRRTALTALFTHHTDLADRRTDDLVDVLWMLLSFETFDALATADRGTDAVIDLLADSALAVVGLDGGNGGAEDR